MKSLKLHPPVIITSRLLPGVRISDSFISIEARGWDTSGRMRYGWHVDAPDFSHSGYDLKSGVGRADLQEALHSLLSFLSAAAESYAHRMRTGREGENEDLFPPQVVEWAYQHSDEIDSLCFEIEETPNLIES